VLVTGVLVDDVSIASVLAAPVAGAPTESGYAAFDRATPFASARAARPVGVRLAQREPGPPPTIPDGTGPRALSPPLPNSGDDADPAIGRSPRASTGRLDQESRSAR